MNTLFEILKWIFIEFAILGGSIILHEVGHIIAFCLAGVGIQEVISPFFRLKRINNRFIIVKHISNNKFVVIPKVPEFRGGEAFNHYIRAFANAILVGPLVNIFLILILIMGVLIGANQQLLMPGIFINIYILLSCFKENDNSIGDFIAQKRLRNDLDFAYEVIEGITANLST